jgi:hypothetical protein
VRLTGDSLRGGPFRSTTFQWTEIWTRLRPEEVDLGRWGTWGTRGRIAAIRRVLRFESRAPRKMDFEHNFALSGARCESLMEAARQAPTLRRLLDRDPARWGRGVVVIRIGINSLGKQAYLDEYAAAGPTADIRDRVNRCVQYIAQAMALIRAGHPTTRIVLVGIADDTNWAKLLDRWQDPVALANIRAVLDLFDGRLREMAAADAWAAFFDERDWFGRHWGGRAPDGRPAYRSVSLGGSIGVTNSVGDHPANLAVADGHAGTAANGLWLRELIGLIESRWALGFTGIRLEEIARLADPTGALGISAAGTIDTGAVPGP